MSELDGLRLALAEARKENALLREALGMRAKDWSQEPISIAAIRADKEYDANLWKPRDALLDVLRDIDSGVANPATLVVVHRGSKDGDMKTRFACAGNGIDVLGMMERAKYLMLTTS